MRRSSKSIMSRRSKGKLASWAAGAAAVILLALISACSLAPYKATMERQARVFPWAFGPSVSDGVYSPAIVEDVYSQN